MSFTLSDIVQLLSSNPLFVVVVLSPFPALAAPIAPQSPSASPPGPGSSHIDHRVIFGIVFVLVFFLTIELGFACVGSRMPLTWFVEINKQIYAASVTVMQRLSSLRLFRLFEKVTDTFVDTNDVGTSATRGRSGGTGNLSTISRPAPVHVRGVVSAR